MLGSQTAIPIAQEISIQDRISTYTATLYQVVALVVFALVPIFAFNFLRTPYLGVLVEHTLLVNGVGPWEPGTWNAYDTGLDAYGQRLLAIDGQAVSTPQDVQAMLRTYSVGDVVTLVTLDLERGDPVSLEVALGAFPLADQIALFYVPYFIGLVYLLCSLWVFNARRKEPTGRAFVMFASSAAIGMGASFDIYTTNQLTLVWTAAVALAGGGLLILGLTYPQGTRLIRERPIFRWLPILPTALLILYALSTLINPINPGAYVRAWQAEYVYLGFAIFIFLGLILYRHATLASPIARGQTRIILFGSLVGFLPIGVWFLLSLLNPEISFSPIILLPLVFFALSIALVLLQFRHINTDFVLSQAFTYGLLTILTGATYALIVWGSSLILSVPIPADNPFLIGLMIFLVALVLNPIRRGLQKAIDRLFFRGRTVYEERLAEFSTQLTQTGELPQIIGLINRVIASSVSPAQSHIYLYEPLSDQYIASQGLGGRVSSDIRFSIHSALAQYLSEAEQSAFLGDMQNLPRALLPDRSRLALLGALLFIPLPGQQQLTGWLALGPRKTGERYSTQDLTFIESIARQAAVAIERAQVVFDLERRVHEMNVLGRVAQGVNVTIYFDDILELIYAQTVQVLPAEHLRITLYDEITQTYSHVFYLENDDRLIDLENQTIPAGVGLEQEVVQIQRAINTEDYDRECRRRSIMPAVKGLYAWIGVPLNAGTKTIGAISLGSKKPALLYTPEQGTLLQAIADQAAGAIIKTRLLDEAEHRARQLEMLNQVSRGLTSTLEVQPLLERVLESAVEILNCEAGSLVMVDEETSELVFEVTVSPVADDLTGMRLAPGTGLVGKSIDTNQPIIDNDVHRSKDWFDKTDQDTGFVTRGLLVVPIQVRDEVIGALEVINKLDGLPFTIEDEQLLSAFTAQAAVSLQNARLFTMTDRALANRVEELSVMQRIDRELNASLDLTRVLHITLNWAMRQSGAEAGLVGVVDHEMGFQVMATQGIEGYGDKLEFEKKIHLFDSVQDALESKRPQIRADPSSNGSENRLLENTKSQMAVPIRRQQEALGLLYLESSSRGQFSDEISNFLNRLSDHAAIAISNAQFYAELQSANLAKSDFISFVSHELKTPMTSIKGYTDLLSAGAVGAINEAQSGFLTTIRSNVERMATLVSDLADVSRIEAGRLRLEFGAVHVQEIIDDVVRSTERQLEEKSQKLSVILPADLPRVWGDRVRLVQIISNLMSNAQKYTPEGGEIQIKAKIGSGGQSLTPARDWVEIAVVDTGIGIRQDDHPQIFTKFFRSEDQKAREAPGTGLGLNITKNLVEMQGGTIRFDSEYRGGTTFFFTIPVAETG